jgi:hypothetical protein
LFVGKFSGLSIDEAFVQVGGQRHETHFAQTKIGQLNVSHGGNEQVIRLQVAVDDPVAV